MVIVAAHNEADRIGATLDALARAFPGAELVVADDASTRRHAPRWRCARGPRWSAARRPHGKGANVTAAAEAVLDRGADRPRARSCSATATSAPRRRELAPLVDGRGAGRRATSRWPPSATGSAAASASRSASPAGRSSAAAAIARSAPISGQRAMRAEVLRAVLPFAPGYGMETAMTIDAVRAGYRLARGRARPRAPGHRPDLGGFLHRAPPARATSRAPTASRRGLLI